MESEDTKIIIPQYNNFHINASVDAANSADGNFSTTLQVDLHLPSSSTEEFITVIRFTDLRKLLRGVILCKMAIIHNFSLLHFL